MLKGQRSTQSCSGPPTLNYRTTKRPNRALREDRGRCQDSRGQSRKKEKEKKMAREELQKKDNIGKKKEEDQEMKFEETITFVPKN